MKELEYSLLEALGVLVLNAKQLEKFKLKPISKAKSSHNSGARVGNKALGIEIVTEVKNLVISTIFLHNNDDKTYKPFIGELPAGINFNMDRKTVQKLLGKPDWSVEKNGEGIFAILNAADKWFTKKGDAIRVQYAEDESHITLISLSSAQTEKQFK
jgi:hypothetical protein